MAHGTSLLAGAKAAQDKVQASAMIAADLTTDVPYVRIEPDVGVLISDDDLKRLGLVPVMHREDRIIAAYATDTKFGELQRKVAAYMRQTAKHDVLSRIERLGPWTRADRTSSAVAALAIQDDGTYTVDLTFLSLDGERVAPGSRNAVARFVVARGGQVLDQMRSSRFEALRVRLGGQALELLLDHRDDVALVDVPPKAHVSVPAVMSFSVDDLPVDIPAPDESAPAICVIDAGIVEGHPMLASAIIATRSKSYPGKLGPPIPGAATPAARHGTGVAGVALFGDVAQCVAAKRFEPAASLINARLLDDNAQPDPDRMPFVREIVEGLDGKCRIFNLSLGLDPCSTVLSPYAADLDAVARERDAVFIISAGNLHPKERYPDPSDAPAHPEYLLDDGRRVLQPAEALNALTVGSISTANDPHPAVATLRGAAGKRAASAFTRCGALRNVIKPELVEEGGDLGIDTTLGWVATNAGLRIPTTGPEFAIGKLFTYTEGTSIAAPKVAHLAARIMSSMPDASANLIRALLINSASFPEGAQGYSDEQAMRLCGFGVPSLDRASHCTDTRATMFFAGEIAVDEVLLFEIPVPQELNESKGRKRITATLAYDPPVSVLEQVRPAGIHVTWKVARADVTNSAILAALVAAAERELTAAADGDTKTTTKKKKVFEAGELPRRIQRRGTVQKNVFEWSRKRPGDTWRLALTAKATRAAHAKDKQRFAVVVTVEHAEQAVEIYPLIRTRLPAGRVRVRVPVGG